MCCAGAPSCIHPGSLCGCWFQSLMPSQCALATACVGYQKRAQEAGQSLGHRQGLQVAPGLGFRLPVTPWSQLRRPNVAQLAGCLSHGDFQGPWAGSGALPLLLLSDRPCCPVPGALKLPRRGFAAIARDLGQLGTFPCNGASRETEAQSTCWLQGTLPSRPESQGPPPPPPPCGSEHKEQ